MKLTLNRVERNLRGVTDLPTLPKIAQTLGRMVSAPHISAADVGKLIGEDQALSARVLHLVNSAYYGFPQQIKNVTHAIVILGFNKIRDVVLSASVIDSFRGRAPKFDLVGFWKHSIATAIACDTLARTLGSRFSEDAFVAGLLHDIGKLLLAAYYPADFQRVVAYAMRENVLLRDSEELEWGVDHSAIGRILAERWSFPPLLVEAIQRHHAPMTSRLGRGLASLVHAADILARAVLVGSGGDRGIPRMDPGAKDELRLTSESLDRAIGELCAALDRGRAFFELLENR